MANSIRYELYSLICEQCGARNAPDLAQCAGCSGKLTPIRRCSSCQSENPPNAYVCLSCYKVLKQKPQVGLLHCQIPWGVSVVVLAAVMLGVAYRVASGWMDYAQAQFETSVITDQYLDLQQRAIESRREEKFDVE